VTITPADLYTFSAANLGATSKTSSTISPTPNALVEVWVSMSGSTGTTDLPTSVTSTCGLTFDLVEFTKAQATAARAQALYRAQSAAAVSGTVTISWGYQPDDIAINIVEFQNAYVGNNGADAILQSSKLNTAGNALSTTAYLEAFQSSENYGVGFFIAGANAYTMNPESGWSKLSFVEGLGLFSHAVMVKEGGSDLSCTAEWTAEGTPASHTYVVQEIRAAGTAILALPTRTSRLRNGSSVVGTTTVFHTGDLGITGATIAGDLVTISSGMTGLFFDSTFIGASVSATGGTGSIGAGATITAVAANGASATISGTNTAGSPTTINVTRRKSTFVAGRGYAIGCVARRSADPRVPTSVAIDGGGQSFTKLADLTFNTDWTLSVWYVYCTANAVETVTATYPVNMTNGGALYLDEVVGVTSSVVVAANVATATASSATTVTATLSAFQKAANGWVAFIGCVDFKDDQLDTNVPPTGGKIIGGTSYGTTSRHCSSVAGRNNLTGITPVWAASSSVGIMAVELDALVSPPTIDGFTRGVNRGILRGRAA
jgi:hypothetical protein